MDAAHYADLTPEQVRHIAQKLKVREDEVIMMNERLAGADLSLNAPISAGGEGTHEWQEWIEDERENQEIRLIQHDEMTKRQRLFESAFSALSKREQDILRKRRLEEPPYTLEEVSEELGISRERVRQIEIRAFEKLQKAIKRTAPPSLRNV